MAGGRKLLLGIATLLVLGGAAAYWLSRPEPGDPRLNAFVTARPPVPIVFTSRTEPASFSAAAPDGEGFTYPGQRPWAARAGRLRLLTPRGTVQELTWGKTLPDGQTLIDVMSPSVSIDGRRILFAGRKGGDDHGRFRLYEIGVDGRGLRQITGGPDDAGCTALPPMRWRADGSSIPDAERRAIDYDDVDPIELNFTDRRIVFASSRTPDLGRDHARRSTTLWLLQPDGRRAPASANRNNDRWPYLLSSNYIAFSLWSRNREVVSADLRDIRPYEHGVPSATAPTDAWFGAFTQIPGGQFGMLAKPSIPVWRPRPLFANRIAFMTTLAGAGADGETPPLTVVQVAPGYIAQAPSAVSARDSLPLSTGAVLRRGPERDTTGRPLRLATPSACPPEYVVMAGAPVDSGVPAPGAFGLYLARDDWPESNEPANAAALGLQLLFDDPDLVDAEPVAVYDRDFLLYDAAKDVNRGGTPPAELALADGRLYRGPMGQIFATAVDSPGPMHDLPGQRTDRDEGPIFASPPPGTIDHVRFYAARRDRFDDPTRPRVTGEWELIMKVPVNAGAVATWAPADAPTVLAGFDKSGRVAQWQTPAKDSRGRRANLFAYAGDHYSLTQPNGRHFCVGCHPGHSGLSLPSHQHAERRK